MLRVKRGPFKGLKMAPVDFVRLKGGLTYKDQSIGNASHIEGSIVLSNNSVLQINLPIGDFS